MVAFFFLRALSMASKFPHVQFIGIDLAPAILSEHGTPENCRFELGDVNRGFPHFHGQIDLIHMRQVSGGVSPRRRMPSTKPLSGELLSIIGATSQPQFDQYLCSSDNKLCGDCRGGDQVPKAGRYVHPH